MSIFEKKKDRLEKFKEVTEDSTEAEKREAESILLKPEPIKEYNGAKPKYKSELESRTALIVFKNKAQMDLIGEIFSIRTSVSKETYITNISLLERIARGVKEGRYVIDNGSILLNDEITEKPSDPEPVGLDVKLPKGKRKLK